jgi:nucleoside triphosphatase
MADPKSSGFPRGIEVVTGVLIENGKGEIFLARSPKWGNRWVLPGGHVEPGEKIASAAVREGREETSLSLKPISVIRWGEMVNSKEFHRPAHFIYFHIYCKLIRGRVKLERRELTDWRWVRPEDALKFKLAKRFTATIRKFIVYKQKGMS